MLKACHPTTAMAVLAKPDVPSQQSDDLRIGCGSFDDGLCNAS
jgi:hypothetical protein